MACGLPGRDAEKDTDGMQEEWDVGSELQGEKTAPQSRTYFPWRSGLETTSRDLQHNPPRWLLVTPAPGG